MPNLKVEALKLQLENGVSPAMATPLLADGYTVNTAVIPDLVDFLIEAGSKGLFVGGTTGEGILLATAERMSLHEAAHTAVNGRVPVLLHTGTNRLADTLTLSKQAEELDVAAISAVTPFYYGMDDAGLGAYYQAIAQAVPQLPLLLYDIPHLATNGISPELFKQLILEIPSLAGVKTSRPDAQIIRKQIQVAANRYLVLAGNEAIALASLAMGASGLISGLSTAVPEPFVALTQAFAAGNLAEAQRQHQVINQLLALLPSGARIGAVKQILTERGFAMGTAVPPRPMPTQPIWPAMQELLQTHSLLS